MTANRSALIGFLFAIPFIVLNLIVSLRIDPFYSFLGSFPVIRNSIFTPLLLLLLFPVGALIALLPILQKRHIYMVNVVIAAVLLFIFFFLFIPLAKDFYTCDILQIPNCD